MFKSGDVAVVRADGRTVTIVSGLAGDGSWTVETSEGLFHESELGQAHPSVLQNAAVRPVETSVREKLRSRIAELKSSPGPREQSEPGAPSPADDSFDARSAVLAVSKAEKLVGKLPVDFNGHWMRGTMLEGHREVYLGGASHEDALALAARKTLDHWIPVAVMGFYSCSCCGARTGRAETNGELVRLTGAPCEFPDGLPPVEWELNVPSGRLVVANDLRDLFPLMEDDFDVNTQSGCRLTTLAYAEHGMSHASVGNTCPGVYRCSDGSYKVASPPWEDSDPMPEFDGTRLAGVCTDLWWYSICDKDEFEKRLKHFGREAEDFSVKVVDVEPGVYRFNWDARARAGSGPGELVYTRFERVRGPDPVQDLVAKYDGAEVNPNAYVHRKIQAWPDLYGRSVTDQSWQRVADSVFFMSGSGITWHRKGFPNAAVDPTVQDVEPPSFRRQYGWYPFSKPYAGIFRSGLAPSFAKLAFRSLESIISFGAAVHDEARSRDVLQVRERMAAAAGRYREMAAEYPGLADPEYEAWLSQPGRAESWIAGFDLGPEFTEDHRLHAEAQRWVPEGSYAVEFDARRLSCGHFAWHPRNGGWSDKKNAQRYAISAWRDNGQPKKHNCFWTCHATNTSIPLYSVARIVGLGEVSHMGDTLVEVAFDYGTPWMTDATQRKALIESGERAAIRVLTRKEYDELLPSAALFYRDAEESAKKPPRM